MRQPVDTKADGDFSDWAHLHEVTLFSNQITLSPRHLNATSELSDWRHGSSMPVRRSGQAGAREPAFSRSAPGQGYRTPLEFDVASRAFVRPPEDCYAEPLAAARGRHSNPRGCDLYP